eukprot:169669-Pleurochrysis_carterae.AAC.1
MKRSEQAPSNPIQWTDHCHALHAPEMPAHLRVLVGMLKSASDLSTTSLNSLQLQFALALLAARPLH